MKKTFISVAALSIMSSAAMADASSSVRMDYDVNLERSDNGYSAVEGEDDPVATVGFGQSAYLSFAGEDKNGVSYSAYINILADSLDGGTEVATASKKILGDLKVTVGRTYMNVGGYDAATWGTGTIFVSPYTENHMPFKVGTTMMFSHPVASFGDVTVQLVDDVIKDDAATTEVVEGSGYRNTKRTQPAALLQWQGNFGGIKPLIQYVPYDNAKSTYTSVSVAASVAGADISFDYAMDSRSTGEESTDAYTSTVLDITYNMEAISPFFKYATFDKVQDTTDAGGNGFGGTDLDDNGTRMTLGLTCNALSSAFAPYFAYKSETSNRLETADVEGAVEAKSKSSLVLGFGGSIGG